MSTPEPPVLDLQAVGREFRTGGVAVPALRDATLAVHRGDYMSIVGPSGSGKSTLLHVLGCLDRPTSGLYMFEGVDTAGLGDGERAALRGQRIGFVFQAFHLLSHRSALENVVLAQLYNRSSRRGRRARAEEALARVGLSHRITFEPGLLSGGERQRVAIARAIVTEPALLLADEPTGNLDTATTEQILELFDDLRRDGLTLMVITHDQNVSQHARRRAEMTDGVLSVVA